MVISKNELIAFKREFMRDMLGEYERSTKTRKMEFDAVDLDNFISQFIFEADEVGYRFNIKIETKKFILTQSV